MQQIELAYANRSILYSKFSRLSIDLVKKMEFFRRIFTVGCAPFKKFLIVAGIRALREDSHALRLPSELADLRAANVHRRICGTQMLGKSFIPANTKGTLSRAFCVGWDGRI